MAILSLVAQLAGICVGLYLMLTRGFVTGATLIAIVAVGHFVFTKLSDRIMLMHQRRMSSEDLRELQLRSQFGIAGEAPAAWRLIANSCGFLYATFVAGTLWYFLVR